MWIFPVAELTAWRPLVGPFLTATIAAFVVLCIATVLVRMIMAREDARRVEVPPADSPDFLLIQWRQWVATAKASDPVHLLLFSPSPQANWPEDETRRQDLQKLVQHALRDHVRASDVVGGLEGRSGVLLKCPGDYVTRVALRLLQALNQSDFSLDGTTVFRAAFVAGVASAPAMGLEPEALAALAVRPTLTAETPDPIAPVPVEAFVPEAILARLTCGERLAQMAERLLTAARKKDQHLSFLYIDIDFLARYNDQYGRPAGDQILGALADLLIRSVRKDDLVGRMGDDDFLVVMSGGPQEGLAVGKRITERCRDLTLHFDAVPLKFTVSTGVASTPIHGRHFERVLESARAALLSARHRGHNNCVLFDKIALRTLQGTAESAKDF